MEILDKIIYRYLAKKNYPEIAVLVNDCVGLNVICHEVYEKKDLELILSSLNEEVFNFPLIDVGANIGNHSLFFSNYFKKIIAFEPQKKVFKLLEFNTSDHPNIEIFNFGLSNEKCKLQISYDKANRGGATFKNDINKPNSEVCDLNVFDDFYPKLNFSFVKIDVEGFELNVLKGMKKNILKNLPIIAFEGKIDSTEKIIKYLSKIGYDTFLVPSDYKINKYIKSNNLLILALRFLIRKLSFGFRKKLVKISEMTKDYNLIIAVSKNSKFNLK